MSTRKTGKEIKMSKKETGDRLGHSLYAIYLIMLAATVIFIIRIFYIQVIWTPDKEISQKLSLPVRRETLPQKRGSILSEDGRPLAISYPRYQLYIDCYNQEDKLNKMTAAERADAVSAWKRDAALFAQGLEKAFDGEGKSAEYYKNLLYNSFDKKSHYLKIGKPIEKDKLEELKKYPLIKDGRYKGGVWTEPVPIRQYPYGSIARRTIGSVTENEDASYYSGIEGKFNSVLQGKDGYYYTKKTDNGFALDTDSLYVDAIDGKDIRTTINVDYQDIADRALRSRISDNPELNAGCCVIMEVKTGAIKAMVNLSRNSHGVIGENENVAVTWRGEPGSVFKISTLMTAIEDGYVKSIDETIPGNHGILPGYEKQPDKHITEYEREHHTSQIPLRYCVQVSSNYAFRYLAKTYYSTNPQAFIDKIAQYQLTTPFEFDVAEKITSPDISTPAKKSWSRKDLTQIAMGYSVSVTPMHLLMYYNAIAGKGKMMKPYLVEDIEENGKVVEKRGPSVLSASICSPTTALMLTDALSSVTEKSGTAWRLKNAPCSVAGKTGTSYVAMAGGYQNAKGEHKQQGTFVGFFPAEDPQYTIVCSIFTGLTRKDYFGGVIPVQVALEVIKELYKIDPYWNEDF